MNRFFAFHRLHIIWDILWIVVVWQLDDHICRSTVYQWGEYWQLAKPHEAISFAKGGILQVLNEAGVLQVLNEANMEITCLILGAQNESAPFSQLMAMGQTKRFLFVTESNSTPSKPNTVTLWPQVLKVIMDYICI